MPDGVARLTAGALAVMLASSCSRGADTATQEPALSGPRLEPSSSEPRVSAPSREARAPEPVRAAPVAVVELFTSEGCSSCPAADSNLARIADSELENVYALSFHVDYWNQLGWRDPFSDPEYSARQRDYARSLGTGRIYTPQMVINGRVHVVGSHRKRASEAIARALERAATVVVFLSVRARERELTVRYDVRGETRAAVLTLVVTQPASSVAVESGENAGRTLSHANVVRVLEKVPLEPDPRGTTVLLLPPDVRRPAAELVGFVQDRDTLHVRGAASVSGF